MECRSLLVCCLLFVPKKTLAVRLAAGVAIAVFVRPLLNAHSDNDLLAKERADAKRSGLVLSTKVLSAPMPPENENAAPLYEKFRALDHEIVGRDASESALESERSHSETFRESDWLMVQKALQSRSAEIALLRQAAQRPKCVYCLNEYVPRLTQPDALGDPYMYSNATLRAAMRLLIAEAIWEAHQHHVSDAIRDLTYGFAMARQARSHDSIDGYLSGCVLDSLVASGFRKILRRNAADPGVCRAVERAILDNYHPGRLSDTFKIEAACSQDMIDQIREIGSEASGVKESAPNNVEGTRMMDAYGAFELQQIRRCIAVADRPYAQSASVLREIGAAGEARYPEKGDLPNFVGDFSGAAFHRDFATDYANIVRCGAAVLAYHAEKGKYPRSLVAAMPTPPTDAVDGKPLHYEITATGFVLSATHQRPEHNPEPVIFRYPQ